ncbi:glycosyl transferase [Polymorphobacter multimanifer]|uniref:glycosyltransferase family 2 protein n=1 Tax=Polymorphobacter multimanifer TaxID=1070431 RepID=UPI00166C74CA|nr:glycosyltransferase family 2 protein [Polymorphobacter multimanifer]GGI79658.1 glycosyl transferase [Polymorphobacter multimanifer]
MKITIITAVYNREATIGAALASLHAQTHAHIEHLIIDGGSTDGTLAILRAAATRADTTLGSEPDHGIYDALNKGLARATGDVIGILHSDDEFADPQVLADVAAAFAASPTDAVYGDLDYVAADGSGRIIRHWRSGPYSRSRLARGWMPPHPALFIRKPVIDRHGGYDTRLRIAADYDAILRWFTRGHVAPAYVPRVLVRMRVGGESNRSLERIIRKSREDLEALRQNKVGGLSALAWKNLSKLPQFLRR